LLSNFLQAEDEALQTAQYGRPFRRVLVSPGSGMTPGMTIGLYDAACDAGKKPDLIIATCGSSLSAASIGAYPNREQRNEFLGSPDHHSMYLSAVIRRPKACGVVCRLANTRCRGSLPCLRDTSVFDVPIMEVPLRPLGSHHIHRPFPRSDSEPRIIILASEISYCPNCEPRTKEHGKFYRETYFTDEDTAQYLHGRMSVVAQQFPDSAVELMTQVKLGQTMGDAARASISDPYYINLTHIDGRHFATGAVNLHPIELAQSLADEVIIPYYYPAHDPLGQSGWGTFFGYDIRERNANVNRQCATHWVDFSDFTLLGTEYKFDPVPVPSLTMLLPSRDGCCPSPMRLVTGVPADLCGFRQKLQNQYCYAYERAMEAFGQPAGSQAHVRIRSQCDMTKACFMSGKFRVR
jgi:hypothetical protein